MSPTIFFAQKGASDVLQSSFVVQGNPLAPDAIFVHRPRGWMQVAPEGHVTLVIPPQQARVPFIFVTFSILAAKVVRYA
jgi:hypothetical protein